MAGRERAVLSPEQEQMLALFEKGRRLQEVISLPGWQDVLDILEKQVEMSEYHLLNYDGAAADGHSDKDILWRLHAKARAKREMFDVLQKVINAAIEQATQAVSTVSHDDPFEGSRPGMF